ncbi:uroporphyrinogen-III synthase [Defluviimonas sp. SAOS-178_SWC]|uniref:uroporphyrinogen-III synthase n=1 Tax=Defluviimonas sp. SAOS-178_SWC TaxID=3121287 RepID=UPI00322175F1
MDPNRPTLLLTRPEAQSRRFADSFRARFGADWPVVISPLSEIALLSPELPEGHWPDLIFSSENVVQAYAHLTSDRSATAWCVGGHTASVAKAAGFRTRTGPGDAEGLCKAIIAAGTVTRLLYPRPVHAAGAVQKTMEFAGIETVSVVLYDQIARPPSADALRLLAGPTPVLLPLFSPRSAALAADAFEARSAPLWIAAISNATAEAGRGLRAARRIVASRPDAEAVLDALGELIAASKMG